MTERDVNDVLVQTARVCADVGMFGAERYRAVYRMSKRDCRDPHEIREDLISWAGDLYEYADAVRELADAIEDMFPDSTCEEEPA